MWLEAEIEDAIKAVEEAVQGDDKEKIDKAAQKLSEVSGTLAQKLYSEQAQEAQNEAKPDPSNDPADDAMDAEFEEVKEEEKSNSVLRLATSCQLK